MSQKFIYLEGKYTSAKIFTGSIEQGVKEQTINMCNNPAFAGAKIRIMPDCHKGKGSVIGFTATVEERIIPNTVGVDINCGMYTTELGQMKIDYRKLDNYIRRNIPSGFKKNKAVSENIKPELEKKIRNVCRKFNLDENKQLRGIGSLGGGNHFIEIDLAKDGTKYLVIHTGSRNFGLQVCNFHQNRAIQYCKSKNYDVPKAGAFLEGEWAEEYFQDMKVAQQYADANRREITRRILNFFDLDINSVESFQTRHNYIDFEDKIIRKGAISAHKGEKVLIPLNMRDGSILAVGKGNEDWNYSAPHGAGRVMSRRQAKKRINIDDYKKSMQSIYTTSVSKSTLDEAPFAYKSAELILNDIKATVEVVEIMRPVYNFKAN